MADRTLSCRDCGAAFVFTEGEQEFFAMKGFSAPTRCPDCRNARKQQKMNGDFGTSRGGSGGYSSGGYSSGGYSSGSYGSAYITDRPRTERGSDGERQLYEVVCAECGTLTQVPFRPRGHRPVYCRDCFERRG